MIIVVVLSIVIGGAILFSRYETKSITSFVDNHTSKNEPHTGIDIHYVPMQYFRLNLIL